MKLNELTIKEASLKLAKREITSLQLTKDCLAMIKRHNKELNACLLIDEIGALKAAAKADKRIKEGERNILLGIPYLAKDNILTKGLKTTAASKMLANYVAPYDATVIKHLNKAGAVLLGKTNLDEFAHGASTEYSAFGATKNPWNKKLVPGGSSGGSAAAVAANFCLFALGTDTGGSVRHPAAFCGTVGLKPSYGLCSRFGLIAMTSSTDVPGCITKTVEDSALVLQTMAGLDKNDATTVDKKVPDYSKSLKNFNWKNITIGIPKEIESAPIAANVKKSWLKMKEDIKRAGGKFVNISLPSIEYALAAYYIITPCEISSNLARFDGLRFGLTKEDNKIIATAYEKVREAGFGSEVKRRIILGTYCLSAGYYEAYYLRAQKVRTKIINEFNKAFKACDIIMTPTTPSSAFAFGSKTKDPLKMYLEDYFLVPASLAGLPAISVPLAKKPLPTAVQFISPIFNEAKLLAIAAASEEFSLDHDLKPTL
ncbi:MAG: Asp-tRNA(Asn)/Glu-tRNA(Gln) amidotransferase subunit GatA [Candidatus Falkowbacteria bacterium]|nr:Asp-tRNA(Asn)/Glu-tRNA(Gln) amidotransferase subunit GatA [Candidatus Falkowbacteria bacterium]